MYNIADYIGRTLESINLEYNRNIEVIVVNDGSTDNSLDKLNVFKKYANFFIINQVNKGVSEARNLGIEVARGEYLLFLDGDDILDPDFFVCLNKDSWTADLIIGNKYHLNGQKSISVSNYTEKKYSSTDFLEFSIKNQIVYWNIGGYVVKKEVLNKESIRFSKKYVSAEDLDFFMTILSNVDIIQTSKRDFFHYRVSRDGSTDNTFDLKKIENQITVYKKWKDKYLHNQSIRNFFERSYIKVIPQISFIPHSDRVKVSKQIDINQLQLFLDRKTTVYIVLWKIFGLHKGNLLINRLKEWKRV